MKQMKRKKRESYSSEFKKQAIELAKELGTKAAAEKLGIEQFQTLGAWVRYSKKIDTDDEFRDLELAKEEIKKLRKQANEDKKVISILKDAAAFFSQEHLK